MSGADEATTDRTFDLDVEGTTVGLEVKRGPMTDAERFETVARLVEFDAKRAVDAPLYDNPGFVHVGVRDPTEMPGYAADILPATPETDHAVYVEAPDDPDGEAIPEADRVGIRTLTDDPLSEPDRERPATRQLHEAGEDLFVRVSPHAIVRQRLGAERSDDYVRASRALRETVAEAGDEEPAAVAERVESAAEAYGETLLGTGGLTVSADAGREGAGETLDR